MNSSSNRGFEHLLKRFHGPKMVKACSRWGSLWFQKLRKIYAVNNSYGFSHNAMYEDIKRTVQDSKILSAWFAETSQKISPWSFERGFRVIWTEEETIYKNQLSKKTNLSFWLSLRLSLRFTTFHSYKKRTGKSTFLIGKSSHIIYKWAKKYHS